jgi:hydroxyacylglutathione hydrolase
MVAMLRKVADGVHVGPLFPRSVFNTVVLEGPEGDVVVDAGLPWSTPADHFERGAASPITPGPWAGT